MGGGIPAPADDAGASGNSRIALDAAAGALAGCISRFVVGPLDVIKIRFQVQLEPIKAHPDAPKASYFSQSKYTSFRQAFLTIVKEEGIQVGLDQDPRPPPAPC
jgi:solute carrier family 25 (mitochondrial thiamine pyrophosphate transporter), member 19